jgi:hypothetical protein
LGTWIGLEIEMAGSRQPRCQLDTDPATEGFYATANAVVASLWNNNGVVRFAFINRQQCEENGGHS